MSFTPFIIKTGKTALLAGGALLSLSVLADTVVQQATASAQRNDNAFRQDNGDGVRKEPLRINPGDKRPADQFKVDVFGHPLTIGGAYELEPRYVEDRRLDPRRDDDVANVYQDLKLELFYQWSKSVSFFVQSDVYYDPEVYTESGLDQYEAGIKLTQAWLFIHQMFDSEYSLQVGRQRIADKRQWWWNDELDAARIYYGEDTLFAELAIAKELGSKQSDQDFIDPVSDRVVRLMGDMVWQWDPKQNLSLFFLSQFDNSDNQHPGDVIRANRKDASDGDLNWFGGRAMGKFKIERVGKIGYWLDSAFVFGEETTQTFTDINSNVSRVRAQTPRHVEAWGMDAGITWYSNLFLEPYLTLGYAYGSGDSNPGDGTDSSYRQSGIHNNKIKLSGSQRFRYYGELFRPELSNLNIMTAALGFPISEQSSIDLLYHHYEQATPSATIRDSRIRATPNGRRGTLGDEFDLVLSLDEWKHLQVQFAGSLFMAGPAFGALEGNNSFQLDLTFKYSF
ncbi:MULTISPECIES: alginate export family protein [Methylomonas]|uniref:Alginate export domain-containing protein n=2 Tax=Methylomonas TaxID=416 RepID=A0A140E7M7_9GAMM|nr:MULTISPECIES: alginate export family protein [Methylomonas]AMK79401.1 hypothetical protein JT25_023430 [Methylomonas denitrificans]OAI03180.1 hypothetical protein A1342_08635 [Methylomonas methanica]TCV86077.1 alginate export protein [Methylomonas methanica]